MKVIRELPREMLETFPKARGHRKGRLPQKDSIIHQIRQLFEANPRGVYEVDCESKDALHTQRCAVWTHLSRLNGMGVFPGRLTGHHTVKGTMLLWMEDEWD